MDIDDLYKPKEIVNEIYKGNLNIQLPVPLEEIAYAVGITSIDRVPLPDGVEGILRANQYKTEGRVIINNSHNNVGRERFSLAHEIGHYLIPTHGHLNFCSNRDFQDPNGIDKKVIFEEKQANEFASELIFPERHFKKQSRTEPDIEKVIELKDLYGSSFSACMNRYIALNDYPVAYILSKDNMVINFSKNREIPFYLQATKGQSINFQSATYRAKEKISQQECYSDIWFGNDKNHKRPEYLQEHVYIQENGYKSTLLYFDVEIEEKY